MIEQGVSTPLGSAVNDTPEGPLLDRLGYVWTMHVPSDHGARVDAYMRTGSPAFVIAAGPPDGMEFFCSDTLGPVDLLATWQGAADLPALTAALRQLAAPDTGITATVTGLADIIDRMGAAAGGGGL